MKTGVLPLAAPAALSIRAAEWVPRRNWGGMQTCALLLAAALPSRAALAIRPGEWLPRRNWGVV